MKKYLISLAIFALVAAVGAAAWLLDGDVPYWAGRFADALTMRGYVPATLHCQGERDAAEGQEWTSPADGGELYGVAFSPCGGRLLICGDGGVRILDAANGNQILYHDEHLGADQYANSAAFSTDGKVIASASGKKMVELWDSASGERLQRLEIPVQRGLNSNPVVGAFSPSGRLLAVLSGHKILVFDVTAGKLHSSVNLDDVAGPGGVPDGSAFFTLNDSMVATGYYSGTVAIWDVNTGEKVRQFDGYSTVVSLSLSPDGRMLAATTRDLIFPRSGVWDDDDEDGHTIQLWDVATGRCEVSMDRWWKGHQSERHSADVYSVAFSPDGRFFVSGSEDKTIRLWETATGELLLRWDANDKVGRVAVSPDGRRIAAALRGGGLRCFPVDPPRPDVAATLNDQAFEQNWSDLGGADAAQAYRAVRTLSQAGDDIPARIAKRLKPIGSIAPWLAELDNDDFDRREAASKHLAALGPQTEPALRKALAETKSDEVRSRIQRLLKTIEAYVVTDPDLLRSLRAIWVLERIGTPEARTVLEGLAKGAPEARQTQEANAALDFLDKRAAVKPQPIGFAMTAPFGRNNAATMTGLISGTVNYGDASAFGGVYPAEVIGVSSCF